MTSTLVSRCCGQDTSGSSPTAPSELSLVSRGKTNYRQQNAGQPFFSFGSVVWQAIPVLGASGCSRLWAPQLPKTADQGWMLFLKGASGSSPRILCQAKN